MSASLLWLALSSLLTLMDIRPPHLDGTDIAVYMKDGEVYAADDYGEFELDAGATEPQDGRCNAVLKRSEQRYGETRYCTALPVGTFSDKETNYDYDEYCRNHQNREQVMENAAELLKHGYFGQNYTVFERSLDAHEFLFAVDLFNGLLDRSQYEFETEEHVKTIDAEADEFIEEDEVDVLLPMPNGGQHQHAAQELWFFALDEIVEKRMQRIRLEQGVSTSHVVETAEADGVITDRIEEGAEHHLNLPISRVSKDKKERLKVGGVPISEDEDDSVVTFKQNDYTLQVEPDEDLDDTDEVDGEVSEAMQIEVEDPE